VRRPRIASRKPPTTRQRKTENPKRSTTSNAAGRTTSSVADLQERLERQAREIEHAREERAAISEVLRVISSSPGDLQPAFAAMLENAVRICGAKFGNLWLYDGESFRIGATYGAPPAYVEYLRREGPFRADARVGIGRLAQTRQTYQVADVAAQPTHNNKLRVATIDLAGARTVLGVPMLKDGKVVGSIVIYRREVQPFADRHRRRAQGNQPLDLRSAIRARYADRMAARFCAANKGNIQMREGDVFRIRAHYGLAREAVEYALLQPLRPDRSSVTGRVVLDGKIIHILTY
jgi:GAF domain